MAAVLSWFNKKSKAYKVLLILLALALVGLVISYVLVETGVYYLAGPQVEKDVDFEFMNRCDKIELRSVVIGSYQDGTVVKTITDKATISAIGTFAQNSTEKWKQDFRNPGHRGTYSLYVYDKTGLLLTFLDIGPTYIVVEKGAMIGGWVKFLSEDEMKYVKNLVGLP